MAYTYDQILTAQFQNIDAEQAQAAADLDSARHAEDADRVNAAAHAILQLDLQRNALAQRAQSYVAGQQAAPRQNPHNLSDEEISIARASIVDRPGMKTSDDDKLKIYAENKAKLAHMRATGQYSDRAG